MKAQEILDTCKKILAERGMEYEKEKEERSMAEVVNLFKARTGITLTESQGWLFMMCLKECRDKKAGGTHLDSLLDWVNYTALYAEARLKENGIQPKKRGQNGT